MRQIAGLLCLCLVLAWGGGPLHAQDVTVPDYPAWEGQAGQIEQVIDEATATDASLEALRAELADWRARFLAAQDVNAARIATIREQIAALGPAPEEGAGEAPEIAARRAELQAQLETLLAPVRSAEAAYSRADGLIREIDELILARQTDALFRLGPSPLNPALWPVAVNDAGALAQRTWEESTERLASDDTQAQLATPRALAPLIGYLLLGLALAVKGRGWGLRFTRWLRGRVSGHAGKSVIAVVGSLSELVMPVVGLVVVVTAAMGTGIVGPIGALVLEGVLTIGLGFFSARWLAVQIFPTDPSVEPIFVMPPGRAFEARSHAQLLGLVVPLGAVLADLGEEASLSEATRVVFAFPVIVVAALVLGRLGQLLRALDRRQAEPEGQDDEAPVGSGFREVVSAMLGRLAVLVAVAAPLAGAVGYMEAARNLVFPAILTLALIGLVTVLSRFAADVYALLMRRESAAKDALVPVLVTFVLVILAAPVLALIWGAREAQLTEIWARMLEGFAIGETRISPGDLLTFVIVLLIGLGITRLLKAALTTSVLPRTRLDRGGQNAALAGVGYIGVFLSAVIAVTAAGIDLSSLAIVAGALSVGIGFGLQNIVSNFVSGIILLIERPISEGDWIEVGGQMGFVREISVRSTRVETFDRTDVIVPNADLISGQVTNYTRGNLIGRVTVPVGVAYGTDTRRVDAILHEIVRAQPMVALAPEPQVLFTGFGADALEFEIRAILRDVTFIMAVRNDINHEIARRFAEEGIEIPFAQRDIWLRNPEALWPGAASRPAPAAAAAAGGADGAPRAGDDPARRDADAAGEGEAAPPGAEGGDTT